MKRVAELGVAGDGPGLEQRLELPVLRPPLVVRRVAVEGARQRPGAPFGPEVGVGAEHDAVGGRLGHHRQHGPGDALGFGPSASPSWTKSTSTSLA